MYANTSDRSANPPGMRIIIAQRSPAFAIIPWVRISLKKNTHVN